MQVVKLLHKRSAQALRHIDRRRLATTWLAVEALLRGKRLWLTAIGRSVRSDALEKHSVKRLDRLLGNPAMNAERQQWYRWLARLVLCGVIEPVILVDWSPLDARGRLYVLRAAVAVGGRALPLYELVHTKSNDPKLERRLLRELKMLLGREFEPILITDAGFGASWFLQVEHLGWRYVGRVLGTVSVKLAGHERWIPNRRLHALASPRAQALGRSWLRQGAPIRTSLSLYAGPPKGRVRRNRDGTRSYSALSQKHEIRQSQPWLLASNLEASAQHVVALYRRRMQIEESFRDLKSPRHGFALRENIATNPQRVANLLLLAALGVLATWLMGLHGRIAGLDRGLQANTTRNRPVLSTFFIGRRLLAKPLRIGPRQILRALQRLRQDAIGQAIESPA